MRPISSLWLLSFCTVLTLSAALPLSGPQSNQELGRRKAPYSVVQVDGGISDQTPTPKTEVVTIESTRTVTESSPTLPPVTQTITPEAVSTPTATVTNTPIADSTHGPDDEADHESPTSTISVIDPSPTPSVENISITTTVAPSSTPYDDGTWHTTYYKAAEPSSVSETSTQEVAAETTAPVEIHPLVPAGGPSNGTYALSRRREAKPRL